MSLLHLAKAGFCAILLYSAGTLPDWGCAATARKPELLYDLRQEGRHADARSNDAETVEREEKNLTLPPFPSSMTLAKLDLTVPIRFSLR